MKRLLIFAGVLAIWANTAGAAIFVSFTGAAQVAPGIYDWTYLVTLQPDQEMRVNDFATIYDVPNITGFDPVFNPSFGAGSTVLDRTFTVITSGPVGPGVTPGPPLATDDPNLPNVTVELTAGNTVPTTPNQPPTTIGTLHIRSSSNPNQIALTDYLTQGHFGGNPSTSVGTVEVPAAIPEPGSLSLMVVGLLAAGGLAFRRRQM
jgi:hypothetical protein